jgi:hypothetical protein
MYVNQHSSIDAINAHYLSISPINIIFNQSIASTAITYQSFKNQERQGSNSSNLSKPPNPLSPLKLLKNPSAASAFPWIQIVVYSWFSPLSLYRKTFLLCGARSYAKINSLLLPQLITNGSSPLYSAFNQPCLLIDNVAGPFAMSQLGALYVSDTAIL